MTREYITILPLAFSSFHQGRWVICIILAWIHLQGWLTGSGPSGLDWDQAVDGWAGTLGLAPLVGVELQWGPSLGIGHGESVGPVVAEIGTLGCSMVSPSSRKRFTPGGNVGSLPSSSSILNLTCFFGFSSTGVGGLLCHTLLLDSQVLDCKFKSHMETESVTCRT